MLVPSFWRFRLYACPAAKQWEARRLLVLLSEPCDMAAQVMLDKMLQALHLNVATEVEVLELQHGAEAPHLATQLAHRSDNPVCVLAFGVLPDEVGIRARVPTLEVYRVGQVQCLFAPPLRSLTADASRKRVLWSQLQVMFGMV